MEEKRIVLDLMKQYRYEGFLKYLIKYDEQIRNMFIEKTAHIKDIGSTALFDEYIHDDFSRQYVLHITSLLDEEYDWLLCVHNSWDDIIFALTIRLEIEDQDDLFYKDYKMAIIADSQKKNFNNYIQSGFCIMKEYYVNDDGNQKKWVNNYMDFIIFQLDHILDRKEEERTMFDELLYMLKFNEEREDNDIVRKVKQRHEEYMNSEDFVRDFENEMKKMKHEHTHIDYTVLH